MTFPDSPIRLHFGPELLYGFVLTLTRVGCTLMCLPLPGFKDAAPMVRAGLVLGITLLLMPLWPAVHVPPLSAGAFAVAALNEVACGLVIGLALAFLNGAFQLAAQTISMQAGFSFASTFDPASQADSTVLQVLSQFATGLLFFALGIHHLILRLIARSLEIYSAGGDVLPQSSLALIVALGTKMFATGLRLGLPVVALLLLIDIALSVLSRLHSQLHVIFITFPVKTALSFAFLAAILVRWPELYGNAAREFFGVLARIGLQ